MDKPVSPSPSASVRCFQCVQFRRFWGCGPESVGSCRVDPYIHGGQSTCPAAEMEVDSDA